MHDMNKTSLTLLGRPDILDGKGGQQQGFQFCFQCFFTWFFICRWCCLLSCYLFLSPFLALVGCELDSTLILTKWRSRYSGSESRRIKKCVGPARHFLSWFTIGLSLQNGHIVCTKSGLLQCVMSLFLLHLWSSHALDEKPDSRYTCHFREGRLRAGVHWPSLKC